MITKNASRIAGNILFLAALAAFFFGATVPVYSLPYAMQESSKQAQDTKSATGKISSIAQDVKSVTLDTTENGNENTMTFVIDKNTKVTGPVLVGTDVTVEYQPTQHGKLLALNISPETKSQ